MNWFEEIDKKLNNPDLYLTVKILTNKYMKRDYDYNRKKKTFAKAMEDFKKLDLTLEQQKVVIEYYLHVAAEIMAENRAMKDAIKYISDSGIAKMCKENEITDDEFKEGV